MKSTLSLYIFLFAIIFGSQNLLAQNISGKVNDTEGKAVPFANVLLLSSADSTLVKGAITDTIGNYVIEKIKPGNYRISAQMVGYNSTFSEPFQFEGTDKNFPTMQMEESTTELSEVVVAAQKPMIEVTPNAMVLNVESSPVLQNGMASDVLEKSPGVVVDQNGQISVKGKTNVLIYLDGKPTYLSNSDLIRLLETTPANNIEKIEIMENPPARYDAAGNAGIINIVRAKQSDRGLNGSLGLNVGYGKGPKVSPSLDLNYRHEKINLYGNYNNFYNKRYQNNGIYRIIPYAGDDDPNTVTIFDQYTEMKPVIKGNNFRAGADYSLTKKTTLGVLVTGNYGSWGGDQSTITKLGGKYDNPYDGLQAENSMLNKWTNTTYNVNLKQEFDGGSSLVLDADFAQRGNNSNQDNNNYYFSNEGTTDEDPLLVRSNTKTDIDILAVKADYATTIFSDWGLEAGVKTSIVTTDNKLDFRSFGETDYVIDTNRSNQFQYDENINAGYININKKWGDHWKLQAGLRGEQTTSKGYSVTLDSLVKRNYFNLFPSLGVSFTPNEKHDLSVSYSRRIDRPDYGNLNPFEYFLDRFTFERGNPFLKPQYTNSFSMTYGYQHAAYLTLSYSLTTDAITQVLEQDEANQTTYQTTVNLDKTKNYSVNLAVPLPVNDWWTLNANISGFYNDVQSPSNEGFINKNKWSYNARLQNTFTLPGDVKFEASGFYGSPMLWGMFEIGEQYQVDMGISKSIGRLKIQASADDIFNIRKNKVLIQQGDINTTVSNKWESRVFRLNLTYRFGNEKLKGARQRNTASDDIQQRAGGNN